VGLILSLLQAHQSSVSQTVSVGYIKSLQHLSKNRQPLVQNQKPKVLHYYFYRVSEVDIFGMAKYVLRTAVSVNMDPQC